MARPAVYSAFNPPPAVVVLCLEPSMTRQSERDAADVNKIVAQFDRTGMLPQVTAAPLYMDVSGVVDYREALERVMYAEGVFAKLSAPVRREFQNDPALFLDAFGSDVGLEKLRELGLIEKVVPAAVVPVDRAVG